MSCIYGQLFSDKSIKTIYNKYLVFSTNDTGTVQYLDIKKMKLESYLPPYTKKWTQNG